MASSVTAHFENDQHSLTTDMDMEEPAQLRSRGYQLEMLEASLQENIIVAVSIIVPVLKES